jgi:hypothetical protein
LKRALGVLIVLLGLAGCSTDVPATSTFAPFKTAQALIPTSTASRTPEPTSTEAVTPTETAPPEPSEAPTPTARPTDEAGPPATTRPSPTRRPTSSSAESTAEPEIVLSASSYCGGSFGAGYGERFSAELTSMSIEREDAVERLTLRFDMAEGDLHALAHCLLPLASEVLTNTANLASVLRLELPNWEHDQRFSASVPVLVAPLQLKDTTIIQSAAVRSSSEDSAGLLLELGLSKPVPFRAGVTSDTLVLEVESAPQPPFGDNPLLQEQGAPSLPDQPLYFIRGGDIWHKVWGAKERAAEPLLTSAELETNLALSPDGATLAFCRTTTPDTPELGSLWISGSDGADPRQLADIGGCADPAFTPDGTRVVFVAPAGPTPPLVFNLWSVALDGASPEQLSPLDEWSRRAPFPLDSGQIVTRGDSELGHSVLLLERPGEDSSDLSVNLGGYVGIGAVLPAPSGRSIAVEALRASGGADLVLLDLSGHVQATIGRDGFWSRPLGWNEDGTLFYMRATCAIGLILPYQIRLYSGANDQVLAEGSMMGDIGVATASSSGVVLVQQPATSIELRGPAPSPAGPASLWLIDRGGGRLRILASQEPISGLATLR